MANRRMISMIPIAASSRRILKFLLIAVSSPAIAEHHRAEERVERNRRGEALVHAVLHALLHVRHGLFALEAEAEFLERNVREVEDLRAAQLTLAVDLRHVLAGIFCESLARVGEEVGVPAEDHGAARTDFAACRFLSFREPMPAQLALHDLRRLLRPLELRNVERADGLAVAAADAFGGVVRHDAERAFVHRAEHARPNARGIDAGHALLLHERWLFAFAIKGEHVLRVLVQSLM